MNIDIVNQKLFEMKKHGSVITNMFPGCVMPETEFDIIEKKDAFAFVVPDRIRKKCFYAGIDEDSVLSVLRDIPNGVMLEQLYKDFDNPPFRKLFEDAGFGLYGTFVRITQKYSECPSNVPESGRRKLLQKLYDPEFGEIATKKDIPELMALTSDQLDSNMDDVFTEEEWNDIINERRCLLFRAKGKIQTYFVYRIEGKKLYCNNGINLGPANWLYNLERRITDECWEKGIHTKYWWVNIDNKPAYQRGNENEKSVILSDTRLYNDVYRKGGKAHE